MPAIHGFSHTNYASADEKKIELGDHRPIEMVLGELDVARAKLIDLFGGRISNLLVPPWNRISHTIANAIAKTEFAGISGFGWINYHSAVVTLNTHVDIIAWKNDKLPKSFSRVLNELTASLRQARDNNFAPVGLLTHHLAHDENCWRMLEKLFFVVATKTDISWCSADELACK